MAASFVNDPKFVDLPRVGGTPALIASRTQCGEAVVWSPGGDADALAAYLGGQFVSFEGTVYQRSASGSLDPVSWISRECVVVRPPAGDLFTVSPGGLVQEYAMVVFPEPQSIPVEDDAPADLNGDGAVDEWESMLKPELVAACEARGLDATGVKADLVARLEAFVASGAGAPPVAPVTG